MTLHAGFEYEFVNIDTFLEYNKCVIVLFEYFSDHIKFICQNCVRLTFSLFQNWSLKNRKYCIGFFGLYQIKFETFYFTFIYLKQCLTVKPLMSLYYNG